MLVVGGMLVTIGTIFLLILAYDTYAGILGGEDLVFGLIGALGAFFGGLLLSDGIEYNHSKHERRDDLSRMTAEYIVGLQEDLDLDDYRLRSELNEFAIQYKAKQKKHELERARREIKKTAPEIEKIDKQQVKTDLARNIVA